MYLPLPLPCYGMKKSSQQHTVTNSKQKKHLTSFSPFYKKNLSVINCVKVQSAKNTQWKK